MIDFNKFSREKVFIIAEAGCNHEGDLSLARSLVLAAARAGADAVKFQSFEPARMMTLNAPKAAYQLRATGTAQSQFERLEKVKLSREAHVELMELCREQKIMFCSSPFDRGSAAMLQELGVPFFKIPSGEITNLPLLEEIGGYGRPVVLSTGMADMGEIEQGLNALSRGGTKAIALLHCVSDYPARWRDANLRAIPTLKAAFGLPTGFSDHSQGAELALAAVAVGAVIIEKHLTLDQNMAGGDHKASLEPDEFSRMVRLIRDFGTALGHGEKRARDRELDVRSVARKSVVTTAGVAEGGIFTRENLDCKRPGTGIPPARLDEILGRRAARPLDPDHLLEWQDIC